MNTHNSIENCNIHYVKRNHDGSVYKVYCSPRDDNGIYDTIELTYHAFTDSICCYAEHKNESLNGLQVVWSISNHIIGCTYYNNDLFHGEQRSYDKGVITHTIIHLDGDVVFCRNGVLTSQEKVFYAMKYGTNWCPPTEQLSDLQKSCKNIYYKALKWHRNV